MTLGGIEAYADKGTWRTPSCLAALYFQQLAAWGYCLSEVGQIVVDQG